MHLANILEQSTLQILKSKVSLDEIRQRALNKLIEGNFSIPEIQAIGAESCIPDLLQYSHWKLGLPFPLFQPQSLPQPQLPQPQLPQPQLPPSSQLFSACY